MPRGLKKRSSGRGYTGDVQVFFDRHVFDYMLQELLKDESVEEGGKYIGYVLRAGDLPLDRVQTTARSVIVIVDFLPSGPNAVRTAVELMPDGPYQEALFRQIERLDPAIEHVGTWHSHHCNGLETLSGGDIRGYFKTVHKAAYRPDFFVASLVKSVPPTVESKGWINHFLFVRGDKEYYNITDGIRVVDWASTFGELTAHAPKGRAVAQPTAADIRSTGVPTPTTVWFETDEGRGVLAADKRLFDGTFDSVTATRRDSQVTITGRAGTRAVAVTYPRTAEDRDMAVTLTVDDSVVLRMECAITHRSLAFKAALAALGGS